MLTAQERLGRCLDILKDAFTGQLVYLMRDDDDPTIWTGNILGNDLKPRFQFIFEVPIRESHVTITMTPKDGEVARHVVHTYEDLTEWAYAQSRVHGLQEWITPRHFVALVNQILTLDQPLAYNAAWPHEHRVELRPGVELRFEWHEELCRLVAEVREKGQVIDSESFRNPEEAVGWLTLLGLNLKPSA
jgi:hypothetical protein